MSVFLSPVGGAGAQFFDNNGDPLTGGKLYTYAAGTTTPQTTYTTAAGNVAHTNPIVLDSAGRVPSSGEIWLTDDQSYKFVLKDSNDVLQASWDNIVGIGSTIDASMVIYDPPFTGSESTTVETKLAQYVSVFDFMTAADIAAVTSGVSPAALPDVSSSIQAALNELGSIFVPKGTYKISSDLTIKSGTNVYFEQGAKFVAGVNGVTFFKSNSTTNAYQVQIHNANLDGNGFSNVVGFDMYNFRLNAGLFNPYMTDMLHGIVLRYGCFGTTIENPTTFDNVYYPVRIMDNCAEVRIQNPNFDATGVSPTGTIGIDIQVGGTVGANIGCRIDGGYCQGFETGVYDRGVGTQINGTYFEQCSSTDILASGASLCVYTSTQHWASIGNSGIQGISSDGITIISPAMASGARSTGLLNFDSSNSECVYICAGSTGFKNTPIGVITGISFFIKDNDILASSMIADSGFKSTSGIQSTSSGVASTIFSIVAGNRGKYELVAMVPNSGAPANYLSSATVMWDGAGGRIVANNGANLTISLSGANVQLTQTSGSAQNLYWSSLYQPL